MLRNEQCCIDQDGSLKMPPEIISWGMTQGPLGVFLVYQIWSSSKRSDSDLEKLREVLGALNSNTNALDKLTTLISERLK